MKRVLFITPSLCQGGVEQSLITALNNLDEKKYDITLYLYQNKLDLLPRVPKHVQTIIEFDKTKYFRKPKSILYLFLIAVSKLFKNNKAADSYQKRLNGYIYSKKVEYPAKHGLKDKKFDTVISYCVHIGSEMALKIPAERYLLFIHSSDPYYHRDITEKVFPLYDKIVAVSDGVKRVIEEEFPIIRGKLTVLSNFVDAKEIISKGNEEFTEYDGYKKSGKTVLCSCGRFSKEKAYDLAIKSAKMLKENGVNFVWYFVGDGAERGNLEKLIQEKDLDENIVITGYKDNPYPYIKNCDIYVQPSYEEAQPIVVLETVILGKPIVSTATVGGKFILENGKKGIIAPITFEGIAEGIKQLIYDKALRSSFENLYTTEENLKEKAEYIKGWEELL